MSDDDIQQETFSYYNERAPEHDLVYMGKGPAIRQHADEYTKDVAKIKEMASHFGSGRAIDIACGTGFWSPYYAPNCNHVTFLDQSVAALSECKKRIAALELSDKPRFIQGDLFDVNLPVSSFDCALIGFLLSHLIPELEERLFDRLSKIFKPSAQLMLIDSAWSEKREKHRQRSGIEERSLEDGRKFRVYKKYFEKSGIDRMFGKFHFSINDIYFGSMLFAVIGDRTP